LLPRTVRVEQVPEFAKVFCFFSSEKKALLPIATVAGRVSLKVVWYKSLFSRAAAGQPGTQIEKDSA